MDRRSGITFDRHRLRLLAVAASVVMTLVLTAGMVRGQEIDQDGTSVGAVQHGSNTASSGNGGGSEIDNAPAEIGVGDVVSGLNTGGENTTNLTITSTIEQQLATANGGDENAAAVSDNDPALDNDRVVVDNSVTDNSLTDNSVTNNSLTDSRCSNLSGNPGSVGEVGVDVSNNMNDTTLGLNVGIGEAEGNGGDGNANICDASGAIGA